jgi:octaprenyl-diphosphate synthase
MQNTALASETSHPLPKMRALIAEDIRHVNALIIARAQHEDVPLIGTMVQHVVLSGGKRLRPALTLIFSRLLGYEGKRHITMATAIEFIHTATLLHDDVVDDSHLRRGLASANDVWGNEASVLVGDYLLSQAFQMMVEDGSISALKVLSDASAIIAKGEVFQLTTRNSLETSEKDYLKVIKGKTATLFAAACELGAIVADQPEQQTPLYEAGMALGIAFQMMDDALDYSAEQQKLGKTVGDDFRDGKITLPVIHAYAQGNAEEKAFWEAHLGDDSQPGEAELHKALALIHRHKSLEYTHQQAEAYCNRAQNALEAFPPSPEKAALEEIIHFCITREY